MNFPIEKVAKFSSNEKEAYQKSLKHYRDIKNVVDTSKAEGKIEGKMEIAKKLKATKMPFEQIAEITGLSISKIKSI